MARYRVRTVNLTEGVIWKQVLLFAAPLFAASLIQQLYNTVDLMFVGHFLGTNAAAAVGAGSLLTTLLIGFFTGLSVGIGVLSARAFGAGDHGDLKQTIHTAAGVAVIGGLLLMVIGVVFAPVFLRWLNTPDSILPLGIIYMRIYFVSIPSSICYNISSGILRATGNSRSPMIYQLIGGITNVFANWVLIVLIPLGVAGVALATLFSSTIPAVICVRSLTRLPEENRLELRKIRITPSKLKSIFIVGIPNGIQAMVITLSNLIVQANINSLDVTSIAAFTCYFKLENFVYLPIMAFGQAATTFVAQNMGRGFDRRARKGMGLCLIIGVVITVCISTFLLLIHDAAFSLFSEDSAVIALGTRIIRVTFPLYFIYVFLEVFSSSIRGTGRSLPPMVIAVCNMCGVRLIALAVMMRLNPTAPGVAVIYPITWTTTTLCQLGYMILSRCMYLKQPDRLPG